MHYSKRVLDELGTEMERQIRAMPREYTSTDFYTALERNHAQKYENLVRSYMSHVVDRPHAIQKMHTQLMQTVNTCFSQLTRKMATISNPRGGNMSRWVRLTE
jgi:hypothetical protein